MQIHLQFDIEVHQLKIWITHVSLTHETGMFSQLNYKYTSFVWLVRNLL